jgi:hypothetical protein
MTAMKFVKGTALNTLLLPNCSAMHYSTPRKLKYRGHFIPRPKGTLQIRNCNEIYTTFYSMINVRLYNLELLVLGV